MPEGFEPGWVLRLGHSSFGSSLSPSGCLAVSQTGSLSGHWRYGLMSTVSIQEVRVVTLLLSLGGSLVIWPIITTPMPVERIPSNGGASLMIGSCLMTYPGREVAELHTRSRFLMQGYWANRYYLGERVYDTPVAPAQRRVPHAPPRHMCLLEGMTREDLEAWLPEILEYTQERKTHKTAAHYRAEAAAEAGAAVAPAGPAGVVLGDVPFPPGLEVVLDPDLGLGSGIIIPADLRQVPPPLQLDPEHTTHDLEIGRLRSHQSRQSSAVSRLQVELDRLRTRLEVKGIPLDFSDEDDDGSSDDAPPCPPPQAAAGPSQRRR
ncbi:hypothetical protein JCGZ_06018 [Jatropha curcas]|uniref:Aminotransferase-like plant mobile domain-containing protein n=1 Tax=Jatropha curcas TaxID=180498 RepID=A0A067KNR3_JATCU|nr:hypothetical protein JCGZ_06018 [Jatropha curcas]